LRRIKKRYETDCKEYGREPTVAVEEAVAAAKKEADQMFFDVLGRKDRADATRNALNVMNDILLANKLSNSLTKLLRSVNIETKSRHENELRRSDGAEPPSITFAFQACPQGESVIEVHNRF